MEESFVEAVLEDCREKMTKAVGHAQVGNGHAQRLGLADRYVPEHDRGRRDRQDLRAPSGSARDRDEGELPARRNASVGQVQAAIHHGEVARGLRPDQCVGSLSRRQHQAEEHEGGERQRPEANRALGEGTPAVPGPPQLVQAEGEAVDPEGEQVGRDQHHHHERVDGSGYPDGLAGAAIPIGARIVAVADVYDALTSDRPYRQAMPSADAKAFLRTQAGVGLDDEMVDAFVGLLENGIG